MCICVMNRNQKAKYQCDGIRIVGSDGFSCRDLNTSPLKPGQQLINIPIQL